MTKDNKHTDDFVKLSEMVYESFKRRITDTNTPLFRTSAKLWNLYLDNLNVSDTPEGAALRQESNCSCCHDFIKEFGGLVTIDHTGKTTSAVWDDIDVPDFYKESVGLMKLATEMSLVTGVYLSDRPDRGTRWDGKFNHFYITVPPISIDTSASGMTRGALYSEYEMRFSMVNRYLKNTSIDVVDNIMAMLDSGHLPMSFKFKDRAAWLRKLAVKTPVATSDFKLRQHLIWKAIQEAPKAFTHVNSGVIGLLTKRIGEGWDFKQILPEYNKVTDPKNYQRPKAPPKTGVIDRAEVIFKEQNLEPSLARRGAKFSEIPLIWSPKAKDAVSTGEGVFGHLREEAQEKKPNQLKLPTITMSLRTFVETIATRAEKMEIYLPPGKGLYIWLTAAVNADAPLLFKWNHPFSWLCMDGATSGHLGLPPGAVPVKGITRLPSRWDDDADKFAYTGDGLIFLFDAPRCPTTHTLGLFPEFLRNDLHEVRSVIEAHSNRGRLQHSDEGHFAGWDARQGNCTTLLNVTIDGREQEYFIDRWV